MPVTFSRSRSPRQSLPSVPCELSTKVYGCTMQNSTWLAKIVTFSLLRTIIRKYSYFIHLDMTGQGQDLYNLTCSVITAASGSLLLWMVRLVLLYNVMVHHYIRIPIQQPPWSNYCIFHISIERKVLNMECVRNIKCHFFLSP